jgi:hypothetical protein
MPDNVYSYERSRSGVVRAEQLDGCQMPANVYSRERSRSGVVWAVMQENDQIKEMVWRSVLTQLPLPATAKAVYTGFQSRLSLLLGVRHFCFSLRATRWVLRRVRRVRRGLGMMSYLLWTRLPSTFTWWDSGKITWMSGMR